MRGNIEVNGKKMTVTELVEAYLEAKSDIDTANELLKSRTDELFVLKNSLSDLEHTNECITSDCYVLFEKNTELERELRVKEDLLKIKGAISNEPTEEHSARPSIEWYECEMMKGLEEISRQKAIINNLIETIYLLRME